MALSKKTTTKKSAVKKTEKKQACCRKSAVVAKKTNGKNINFVLNAPAAGKVMLAGDFNDWMPDDDHLMIKDEDGNWKKILQLTPGKYQYKLLIDGRWTEDDNNPLRVESPFGGYNSLLEVSLNDN